VPGWRKINRSNYAVWRVFQRFVAKNIAGISERNSSTVLASGVEVRVAVKASPGVSVPPYILNSIIELVATVLLPPQTPRPWLVKALEEQLKISLN
jgi:hypothetical protein